MPFRTILASLTGSRSDRMVLATAVAAARPGASHINCLHVKADTSPTGKFIAATDRTSDLIFDLERKFALQECERSNHARDAFDETCRRHAIPIAECPEQVTGISIGWQEIVSCDDAVLEQSHYHDLTVVARDYELSNEALQCLLLRSGRPLLIAPLLPEAVLDRTVAIAWKATSEAARAVSASLPFLSHAAKVVIIAISETGTADSDRVSAEKLAAYLAWHGVKAQIIVQNRRGFSEAKALRELCRAQNAGLLVMGAYGHSRARELVLGGMTREILADCGIPVFMQH